MLTHTLFLFIRLIYYYIQVGIQWNNKTVRLLSFFPPFLLSISALHNFWHFKYYDTFYIINIYGSEHHLQYAGNLIYRLGTLFIYANINYIVLLVLSYLLGSNRNIVISNGGVVGVDVYRYVAQTNYTGDILTPNSGAQKHFYFATALHHSTQKEAGSSWFFMCLKHF